MNIDKIDGKALLTRLNSEEKNGIYEISKTLKDEGFECYLVGGCVRDLILNHHHPGDIDLTSNARPEEIIKLFKHTVPTGLKHGTVMILIKNIGFEITTYRSEGQYSDARRPDVVTYSNSLKEDLSRRDFTINAICLSPQTGEVIDLHNGINDIQNKIIRTIGQPEERFFEDGLRPIRACRFRSTLEFKLDSKIISCLKNPEIHARTSKVAIERFQDELCKGFKSNKPSFMITELESSGLLYLFIKKEIFPQLEKTQYNHLLELDSHIKTSLEYKLAFWFWSIHLRAYKDIRKLSNSLKFSKKISDRILFFQKHMEFQIKMQSFFILNNTTYDFLEPDILYDIRLFLCNWKTRFKTNGLELLQSIPEHKSNSVPANLLIEIYRKDPLVLADLAIDGKFLISKGIKGKKIGDTLNKILDRVLRNPSDNTPEILQKMLSEILTE